MYAGMRTERRLLALDTGDWSILIVGLSLIAFLTLLV
jgi:hypothetical protein